MTEMEIIGNNLSRYRKLKQYTQEALANELDMSACNIRLIEHGKANPTIDTLRRLARQLGVSLFDLLNPEDHIL